jgi:hypothetical protein
MALVPGPHWDFKIKRRAQIFFKLICKSKAICELEKGHLYVYFFISSLFIHHFDLVLEVQEWPGNYYSKPGNYYSRPLLNIF